MGAGTFRFDARVWIKDELGEFAGGRTVVEAIEVGIFSQGDKAVFVNMTQGTLQTLLRGIG